MLGLLLSLALASSPAAASTVSFELPDQPTRLGVVLDVGVPEGAGASVAFAALPFLRIQLGLAFNGIAPGFRGGVMLMPFTTSFVRPTLSLQVGHFEPGDGRKLASGFSDAAFARSPLLDRLQYDFVSAYVGVEIGRASGTSFFVRGGVAQTTVRLGGVESFLKQAWAGASVSASAPTLTITAPSLQVGLLVPLL